MDDLFKSTPFDVFTQSRSIQMLKTIIPYLELPQQKGMSLFVKYLELQHTLSVFDQPSKQPVSICSISETADPYTQMLSELRSFCTDQEQEFLDTILNLSQMFRFYGSLTQERSDLE